MDMTITDFDLKVRYQVYSFFAQQCRAPSYQEISNLLDTSSEAVRESFHTLHEKHMLFLEPNADKIRMANPFSAIPTRFKVQSEKKEWWANCAWDSVGIAAAMDIDVQILASYPDNEETIEMRVENGAIDGRGHRVYSPLPCRQWYDDLIFT